jgi:transcription factor E
VKQKKPKPSNRNIFNDSFSELDMQSDKRITKLLKQIVFDFAGVVSEKLVDLLFNKKNVNEFLIAKRLGLTINQTRNVLYKLGEEGLVSFIRKKDNKKGGWYTYFWTLNAHRGLDRYKEKIDEKIKQLQLQLVSRQHETFYTCKNCDIEFDNENALLNNYTCPECGEVLEVKDSTEHITQIQNEIKKQQLLVDQINSELSEMGAKEQKIKENKIKEEIKKKSEERKKKSAERKRAKEKLNPKAKSSKNKKKENQKKKAPKNKTKKKKKF